MSQAKAVKVVRTLAAITQGRASFALKNVAAIELVTATKGAGAAGARYASPARHEPPSLDSAQLGLTDCSRPFGCLQVLCADGPSEPQVRQPDGAGRPAARP